MIKLFFVGISIAAITTISVKPASAVPFSFSNIPEPVTMLLLGAWLICLGLVGRKTLLKK